MQALAPARIPTALLLAVFLPAAAESEPWIQSKTLTRGWFGLAEPLAARGIDFDLSTTAYYTGLLSGTGDQDFEWGGRADDEQGVEIFYNCALTAWLRVTADLQWIDPARARFSDAWVAGLRASIDL